VPMVLMLSVRGDAGNAILAGPAGFPGVYAVRGYAPETAVAQIVNPKAAPLAVVDTDIDLRHPIRQSGIDRLEGDATLVAGEIDAAFGGADQDAAAVRRPVGVFDPEVTECRSRLLARREVQQAELHDAWLVAIREKGERLSVRRPFRQGVE